MTGTLTISTLSSTTNILAQGWPWGYEGTCPPNWTPEVIVNGPTVNEPAWLNAWSTTFYVTVSAICWRRGLSFIFIFPWEWNPPTLPIWLWLRGGTNTLAPLEPIYVRVFNAYAEWFWANAGWFIDLLVLIALITPVLARPIISRRIRV